MKTFRTKTTCFLLSGLFGLVNNTLYAGFAPSNISSYWGDAELIAIGSVGRPFTKIHGETAHYYLSITEVLRGPELESLENVEILNPWHGTSNSRWNTGRPGTPAIFFGKEKNEEGVWIVPRAAKLDDSRSEAVGIMRYVDSSANDEERAKRLAEALEQHEVQTFFYLLSEARRLGREDLITSHYQRRFDKNPKDLNAADQLLYRNDRTPLPKLKAYLADPEFEIRYHSSARAEIASILSKRLKQDATATLRQYSRDKDESVALAVANHEVQVENEITQWRRIYDIALLTRDEKIRHNACYKLSRVSSRIPLEALKEVRDYVQAREISVAILNRLNREIERREAP